MLLIHSAFISTDGIFQCQTTTADER